MYFFVSLNTLGAFLPCFAITYRGKKFPGCRSHHFSDHQIRHQFLRRTYKNIKMSSHVRSIICKPAHKQIKLNCFSVLSIRSCSYLVRMASILIIKLTKTKIIGFRWQDDGFIYIQDSDGTKKGVIIVLSRDAGSRTSGGVALHLQIRSNYGGSSRISK